MTPHAQWQAPHTLPVSAPEPVAEDGQRSGGPLPSVRHRRPADLARAQRALRAGEGPSRRSARTGQPSAMATVVEQQPAAVSEERVLLLAGLQRRSPRLSGDLRVARRLD